MFVGARIMLVTFLVLNPTLLSLVPRTNRVSWQIFVKLLNSRLLDVNRIKVFLPRQGLVRALHRCLLYLEVIHVLEVQS